MKNIAKHLLFSIIFVSLIITTCVYFYTLKSIDNTKAEVTSNVITHEKIAYLTFDDGPSLNTPKILDILDKYNIKATFFVVGPSYKLKNDMLKKIVQSGHELAIHSYEHNYNNIYSSKENYIKDFYKCLEWIKKETGVSPKLYRFPGGSSNTISSKQLIKSIINELNTLGFVHADWNVDTLDSYIKNDSSKIISNVLTSLKLNETNNHYYQTILLHDDIKKNISIEALPSLIEKLLAKGYQFKSLKHDSHITKHVK